MSASLQKRPNCHDAAKYREGPRGDIVPAGWNLESDGQLARGLLASLVSSVCTALAAALLLPRTSVSKKANSWRADRCLTSDTNQHGRERKS
jgi:hypothetical protein